MSVSPRWALPLLVAGQAQKEVTHNESILTIDRLLQLAVVSRCQPGPPAEPLSGDIHIIGLAPQGIWAGLAGQLAMWDGAGWVIMRPRQGCLAWVQDEQDFTVLTASGWSTVGWPARRL